MIPDVCTEGNWELPAAPALILNGGAGPPMHPLRWVGMVRGVVFLQEFDAVLLEGPEAH